MKNYFFVLIVVVIFMSLFGCTMNNATFEQSNHVFFERTVDNLEIGKALSNQLPRSSKIAVRSLEMDTSVDQPIVAILEDQMFQSIASAGFSIVERDETALSHLYKESTNNYYNIPKNKFAWLTGKDLKVQTPTIPEGSNWDYLQTNLTSADFVLCYRIQELGIIYDKIKGSVDDISRNGMVRLHVRVYDARTGVIKYANNLTGTYVDTIPKSLMYQLSSYHYTDFYPYDYPMQRKEVKPSPTSNLSGSSYMEQQLIKAALATGKVEIISNSEQK